jgi:hypothetical protein
MQMGVELQTDENLAGDQGQRQSKYDTNDPGGEIRPEDVNRRGMIVGAATAQHQPNGQPNEYEFQKFH